MDRPTHYDVLQLPADSPAEQIAQRYREMARRSHPEIGESPDARLYEAVQAAFAVLGDPAQRAAYDAALRAADDGLRGLRAADDGLSAADDGQRASTASSLTPSEAPAVTADASLVPAEAPPAAGSPASAAPPDERTQEILPPDERTQEIPPPSPGIPAQEKTAAIPSPSREEQDRRLAAELTRRGVAPDEVQRLIALNAAEAPPARAGRSAAPSAPVTVEPPPAAPYVPKPTIVLPDFRDPSPSERMDAERLLTAANVARRRGSFAEAERQCREAIEKAPADAGALELYGDILQSVGRVDDAIYAYQQALHADASRKSAEKKYAELMLLQNREIEMLREEYIPRNPTVAIVFTALFPGAGQVYNGQALKGAIIAAVMGLCLYALGWTDYGFPGAHSTIPASLVLCLTLATGVYIYAVVDAKLGAQRGRKLKSGWEI